MKHYIIVKFEETVNVNDVLNPIKILFDRAIDIKGVDEIEIYTSNIDLPNRYDLMIKMTLSRQALTEFDNSEIHKEWKSKFGKYIISKTIFDCE